MLRCGRKTFHFLAFLRMHSHGRSQKQSLAPEDNTRFYYNLLHGCIIRTHSLACARLFAFGDTGGAPVL